MVLKVLGSKYQNKLLEVIDSRWGFKLMCKLIQLIRGLYHTYFRIFFLYSQLPDFLGGICSCPNEGGCLRSNKGPWNDPDIMKV